MMFPEGGVTRGAPKGVMGIELNNNKKNEKEIGAIPSPHSLKELNAKNLKVPDPGHLYHDPMTLHIWKTEWKM